MSTSNYGLIVQNLLDLQRCKQAEQLLEFARKIRFGEMPDPGTATMLSMIALAMIQTVEEKREDTHDHA